jgi:integrase
MKNSRMWYGQWYVHGKQVRVSLRTPIKEVAKRELRRLMSESERGALPENVSRKLRYEGLRKDLLYDYHARGNKSLQVLATGDETIWGLAALDKFFQGALVSSITVDRIQEFVAARQREKMGNGTINRSLALLRRMFNLARIRGKIQSMPVVQLLREPTPRKGFVTSAQFERLLSCLPANLRPLVTFLYYCGVRVGEATQIEWGQVDLEAALIRLESDQTKTSEARVIPLPDVLVTTLNATGDKQGAVFDATNLRKEWERATQAANVPGLYVHDLRRSAIRNLINAGVKDKIAMAISGHKTRAVFDRYHIVSIDDVQDAMAKLQGSTKVLLPSPRNGETLVRAKLPSGRK